MGGRSGPPVPVQVRSLPHLMHRSLHRRFQRRMLARKRISTLTAAFSLDRACCGHSAVTALDRARTEWMNRD